jgi:hypothetical protein
LVLTALLFVMVGCAGTGCVCRSVAEAEGAGAWVNDRNISNLQGAIEIEENLSPSFSWTCGFLPLVAPALVAPLLVAPPQLAPSLVASLPHFCL